ncbi:MAG: hypothetical protein O6920_05600, partial [Chloroflexi bacterium]|nr:hypothetical protein [Chloroflexota bacterium]
MSSYLHGMGPLAKPNVHFAVSAGNGIDRFWDSSSQAESYYGLWLDLGKPEVRIQPYVHGEDFHLLFQTAAIYEAAAEFHMWNRGWGLLQHNLRLIP